jgi:hypothetical protein
MLTSSFSLSPATTDLKNLLIACGQHTLHAEFRGGMKEPCTRSESVNMGFRCRSGDAVRGFYLEKTLFNKKIPDLLDDLCSLMKSLPAPGEWPVFHYRPILDEFVKSKFSPPLAGGD